MKELLDEELQCRLGEELLLLRQEQVGVRLEMSPGEAFTVCALLQLALRHPEVAGGPAATVAHRVIEILKFKFAPCPAISESIRRGDLGGEYDQASGMTGSG